MKVKIGDQIFDTAETPVMLIFKDCSELNEHLSNLNAHVGWEEKDSKDLKYAIYPDSESTERIRSFMETGPLNWK